MPRVVLAGLVGAMLSVGGASYQGVFRNPLVDPYLLGAAAGAGLGATLMIAIWGDVGDTWSVDPVPAVAFVFALGAVALTYLVGASFGGLRGTPRSCSRVSPWCRCSRRSRRSCCSATPRSSARSTTGSSGDCRPHPGPTCDSCFPYVTLSCARPVVPPSSPRPAAGRRRRGGHVRAPGHAGPPRGRVAATLGTAAVVAVSGLIGFVGLVVPHVVRLLAGASYRRLRAADDRVRRGVPDPRRHPGPDVDGARPSCRSAWSRRSSGRRSSSCCCARGRSHDELDRVRRRAVSATARSEVVRGFTDTVRSGEWLGLIGPNGAGKSSLLKAVVGVVPSIGRRGGRRCVDVAAFTIPSGRARRLRAAGPADAGRHDRIRVRPARAGAVRRLLRQREPPRSGDGRRRARSARA